MIFDTCIDHIFRVEKGFVNNPLDPGGATNFGITLKTLAQWRQKPTSVEDVKSLKREEAKDIYYSFFWEKPGMDKIRSAKVALIVFDQIVNAGQSSAISALQRVLCANFGEHITIDGVLGSKTEVAVATAHEGRLARKLIQAAQRRYADLCQNNSSNLVFLEGWIARTHALWDAIGN